MPRNGNPLSRLVMNVTFPGFIRSYTAMSTDQVRKIEVAWHALLNRPEAQSADLHGGTRAVDRVDRQPEADPRLFDADYRAGIEAPPGQATEFQQRVRELANSVLPLDPATAAAVPLARRYQEIRTKLAMAECAPCRPRRQAILRPGHPSGRPDPRRSLRPDLGDRPLRS